MRAGALILALAWPLLGLVVAIRTLCTETYLRQAFGRAALADTRGFTDAERLALALPSTRFIVGGATAEDLRALRAGGAPLYTDDEVAHLLDVRRVVGRIEKLAALLLAAAAMTILLGGRDRRRLAGRGMAAGGWLEIGFLATLAAAVTLAWEWAFTTMHRLLFPGGNWQFSAGSGLIRLFPDAFWYGSAVALIVLLLAHGSLGIVAGLALNRRAPRG